MPFNIPGRERYQTRYERAVNSTHRATLRSNTAFIAMHCVVGIWRVTNIACRVLLWDDSQ